MQELLFPLTTLVVPVFFVLMGFRVDLRSFSSMAVLIFAGLITLAAVIVTAVMLRRSRVQVGPREAAVLPVQAG